MLNRTLRHSPRRTPRLLACVAWFGASASASGAVFSVTTVADAGLGSLRQAILDANATAGADEIVFKIPGPGVHTIAPLAPLPTVTDTVSIDGYTQPGAQANTRLDIDDAVLLIALDGNAAPGSDGLRLECASSVVRGLAIGNFEQNGIRLVAGGLHRLEGNFIGLDAAGTLAKPNGKAGVLFESSSHNVIGGTAAAARNLVSGNGDAGIAVRRGRDNRVFANFVGPDALGARLGNNGDGVVLEKTMLNWVGEAGSVRGNVIAGNRGHGVSVSAKSAANRVVNEVISDNGGHGVLFEGESNDNGVGGAGLGNTIQGNGGDGVRVASGARNWIIANSIAENGGLGIDLGGDGPTPNDACDADGGANGLQNALELTWRFGFGGAGTVEYALSACPPSGPTTFTVDFYASPSCDPSGFGEGQNPFVTTTIAVPVRPGAAVLFGAGLIPPGHFVSATVTDLDGNTSEFSNCVLMP